MLDQLERAIEIAVQVHKGQKDKGGSPYMLHPLRVMLGCHNPTEMICAVLHDVVEDTYISLDDLLNEGFSEDIIVALDHLTRRKGEDYDTYINRILGNELACMVKMEDLKDNINISRIPYPTQKDFDRQEKYEKAYEKIHAKIYDYVRSYC